MLASLQTLFSRSRYLRFQHSPSSPDGKRRRQEAERFAVAATGFCIRHDPGFARDFIKIVTGHKITNLMNLEVHVEPRRESDLLLIDPNHFVAVVEFKINAKLQPHQNANDESFEYGDWLINSYGNRDIDLFYTVLDQTETKRPAFSKDAINYRHADWSDVRNKSTWTNQRLSEDYISMCRNLGISGMVSEQIMKMKLESPIKSGVELLRILDGVRDKLSIKEGKYFELGWPEEPDRVFMGYSLFAIPGKTRFKNAFQRKLSKLCGKPRYYLAWIGYIQEINSEKPVAEIVIEADSRTRYERLLNRLKKQKADITEDEDFQITMHKLESDQQGDFDWFINTLNAVVAK